MNPPKSARGQADNPCMNLTTLGIAFLSLLGWVAQPAAARIIEWSNYEWMVKASDTPVLPGDNYFSDSEGSVWVDGAGRLHLKIRRYDGRWQCAEVWGTKSLGFGRYLFFLSTPVDKLDRNAVVGMFMYMDDQNEIDIELSRFGEELDYCLHQFVVQPWQRPGNVSRADWRKSVGLSAHGFVWTPRVVEFASFLGHDTNQRRPLRGWSYTGVNIPRPSSEKPHINLWLYEGQPPSNQQEVELIVERFEFQPLKRAE